MVPVFAARPLTDHYLEIQALTAVDQTQIPPNPNQTNGVTFFFPIVFVILLFIGLFGWQFYTRLKDLNRILMILVIGLSMGMIPLTVNIINSRSTATLTKAGTDSAPYAVVVDTVTANSFTISWRTKIPTLGAIKYGTLPDLKSNPTIIREPGPVLIHSLTVENAKAKTTYYIEVFSDSVWFNHNHQPIVITTE